MRDAVDLLVHVVDGDERDGDVCSSSVAVSLFSSSMASSTCGCGGGCLRAGGIEWLGAGAGPVDIIIR